MRVWMQGDSRFRERARALRPPTIHFGSHLEDYEQEFIVSRLAEFGAGRFHHFGSILFSIVGHTANNLSPAAQAEESDDVSGHSTDTPRPPGIAPRVRAPSVAPDPSCPYPQSRGRARATNNAAFPESTSRNLFAVNAGNLYSALKNMV